MPDSPLLTRKFTKLILLSCSCLLLTQLSASAEDGPFHIRNTQVGAFEAPAFDQAGDAGAGQSMFAPDLDSHPAPSPGSGVDLTNAQYDFISPGSSVAREILTTERFPQLPVVPTPPNLRKNAGRGRDAEHTVLLRAEDSAKYCTLKTVAGSLYCKSGAMVLVTTAGQTVRVMNVTGAGDQVLFRLPEQQIVAIGRGTEIVLAPKLGSGLRNPPDGIARRGFSDVTSMRGMQMAFAQFSLDSFFELPEFHHFKQHQKTETTSTILDTAKTVAAERGETGFRKSIGMNECVIPKPKQEPKIEPKQVIAARPKPVEAARPVEPTKPMIKVAAVPAQAAKPKTAPKPPLKQAPTEPKAPVVALKPQTIAAAPVVRAVKPPKPAKPAQPRKEETADETENSGGKLAGARHSFRVLKDAVASKIQDLQPEDEPTKAPVPKGERRRKVAENSSHLDESRLTGNGKALLAAARDEEKLAAKYRKLAQRNKEFVSGGLLTAGQCSKLMAEATVLIQRAELSEANAEKLRGQASVATKPEPTM